MALNDDKHYLLVLLQMFAGYIIKIQQNLITLFLAYGLMGHQITSISGCYTVEYKIMKKLFILHAIIHFAASRLCSLNCTYWLSVMQKAFCILWETPLGVKSCYHVIAVHRVSLEEDTKGKLRVCLSLWISAGHIGIKWNQSLCKLDQWEANNISAPESLLQTVPLWGSTNFLSSPSSKQQKVPVECPPRSDSQFVALVFVSVLTVMDQQHLQSLFYLSPMIKLGENYGSDAHLSVTHWNSMSGTPLIRF